MKDLSATALASATEDLQFVVGQDARGTWVAVETHGLGSGLFCSQKEAIHYAALTAKRGPGHVCLTSARIDSVTHRRSAVRRPDRLA